MAVTETTYTGNGSKTNYSFTFPYLKTTDIKASINGTATTPYTLANPTTVQFNTAPANSAAIRIYRETDDSKLEATFFAGSAIKSSDLNDNFNQNLYVTQESNNKIDAAWTTGDETIISTETWVSNDNRVSTTAAQDGRIDSKIDTALTTDVVGGQSITITDNSPGSGQITASVTAGSIRGTELAGDAVDGTKIADDSIDSEHIASGAVDLEHMSANSVDSDQYVDGSIDLAHMSANSVDSNQYVDGSIDREHLASDVIDGTKLADNAVNSEHITSGAVDLAHMSVNSIDSDQYVDGSIDREHLSADIIDGTKLADNSINSEHYVDGSVDHAHLSNDCIDGDNIQDNVINSEHYVDESIDTAHIGNLQVTTAKIAADAIDSTKLADNSVGAEHISENAVGDSEIATGALDGRYYTKTTSDAKYFNISTGDTIKDGDTFPDNDTTIATTAAINDRIIDLVDDVGGFVPIANETSFPNANPDVNNGIGTLVSIKTLASNLTSNGSGVATIANGTVGNSTVTITGLENSTTYSSGYGMIVETTTTTSTYTYHRLVPKATEVTTVAGKATEIGRLGTAAAVEDLGILGTAAVVADLAILGTNDVVSDLNTLGTSDVVSDMNTLAVTSVINDMDTCATNVSNINTVGGAISNVNTVASNMSTVNDFAARYRVASSDPSSNNDEGDLVFNTTSNELRVYNGSTWQGGVTATGNLASLGANTFTGAQTFISSQTFDGRDVSTDGSKLDGIEAGATADQTNAEIRTAVEAASDSNVFTDADHSKLNAIEASATADQTDAEIRAAVEAASDSHVFTDADHTKLNAIESGATADQTKSDIDALNINADTVDSLHATSFVRSDASDTLSGATYTISSTTNQKLIFSGSTSPYLRFQTGTTNKGYIEWNNGNGCIGIGNEGDGSQLRIKDNLDFTQNGSTFYTVWHAGNDGAGSGLDADTIDGVQGSNYLRSDTSDQFDGVLTINSSTNQKLILQGSDNPYIRLKSGSTNKAYWEYNGGYVFLWNEHQNRGFRISSQLHFYDGSYREILHQNNVGSGGALSNTDVYVDDLYVNDLYASNWFRNSSSDHGLYNSANNNHFYSDSNEYWTLAYNGGYGGLCIRDGHGGGIKGYLYANDSSDIGILDDGGNWSLKCTSSRETILHGNTYPNSNNSYQLGTSSYKWSQVHATTFHGDGSNLTNLPAGGNTIQLTASGSIATNKAVTLNTDGTCSEIKTTTNARTVPYQITRQNFRNNEVGSMRLGYDAHYNKLMISYAPSGGSGDSQLHVAVAAVNSTGGHGGWTHTYGLGEYHSTYHRTRTLLVHDPDRDVNLLFYGSNYGGTGEMRIIQLNSSNNSISYSGSTDFATTASYPNKGPTYMSGCYDTNNDKTLVAWIAENDSNKLKCRVVGLRGSSGTSASVTMGTINTVSTDQCRASGLVFDPDTNKVVLTYHRYTSSIWKGYCRIGTVSGTSISFGSEVTIVDTNSPTGLDSCYDTTNNKVVVGYYRDRKFRAKVGTVSGTSISFGSETGPISNGQVSNTDMSGNAKMIHGFQWASGICFNPESGSVVFAYKDNTEPCHSVGYVSGTSIVLRTATSSSSFLAGVDNNTMTQDTINIPGHDRAITIYYGNNAGRGKEQQMDLAQVTSNASNPNHYLGYVESAVSNGQTATILTYGNTTSNLSGLTTGTYYYVQGDGTLGTSYDGSYFGSYQNTPVAGLALSSSKLLINNSMPTLNSKDGHNH